MLKSANKSWYTHRSSQKLDNVHKIVYLESKITSDDKSTREISPSIELAKVGFSKIKINWLL